MTKTKTQTAKTITDKELIQVMYDANEERSDVHFGFFLGAGASVNSGIPLAQALCEAWLDEIKQNNPNKAKKWKEKKLSEHYNDIFEARFHANPDIGYECFQQWINEAKPSIGYLFLAQILTGTSHKFVVTTNFDTMTEDALFSLNNGKPLVIGHESLTEFIKTTQPTRPVIIKVHRDFLLKPRNSNEETNTLNPKFEKMLGPILKETHLVVLGYGGNDESIMNYLNEKKDKKAIYWCCRDEKKLSKKVKDTLTEKDFIVEIKSFDRFMLTLSSKFNFDRLIHKDIVDESQLVKNAQAQVKVYQNQLEELSKEELSKEEEKALEKQMPDWWSCELEVRKAKNTEDKNTLYLQGLKQHSNSFELHGNYAIFLTGTRKEYDEAEKHYKIALKSESNHTNTNGNYANFLKNIRKKYDEAEKHYKIALKSEPNDANINGNYAIFLTDIRKEHDEAEKHYKIALKSESNDASVNNNYAAFLKNIRKKYDEAEKHYKIALKSEPNDANINGNYAIFLTDIRKKYDEAEEHYKTALKSEPNHANINGNYANFLEYIRKEYDEAEKHYKIALKSEPNDADINGNYANFLKTIRKEYDEAEKHYKTALKSEPNHANINGNYAIFLTDIRKEHDEAEKHYKIALKSEPNDADINGNYANFLTTIRKEHDEAEKHYKIALKSEPNDADINGNYANFLTTIRKEHDEAEKHYKIALTSEPNHVHINGNYAGFLLSQGKKTQANEYLKRAFKYLTVEDDLSVELWFYRLAHYPNDRTEAVQQLDKLLDKGIRSIGWDFSDHIKQAEKAGFTPITLLQEYADKINQE